MIRASVVLPLPGGPQKTSDGTRSSAMARRRKPFGPTITSCPTTSSRVRGRNRSASGVPASGSRPSPPPRRSAGAFWSSKRPRALIATSLGGLEVPVAAVPIDQRRVGFLDGVAGLDLADVDRVGAGGVAAVDRAVEPGDGVGEDRSPGLGRLPGAVLEPILVLHPREAVGELGLLLTLGV